MEKKMTVEQGHGEYYEYFLAKDEGGGKLRVILGARSKDEILRMTRSSKNVGRIFVLKVIATGVI